MGSVWLGVLVALAGCSATEVYFVPTTVPDVAVSDAGAEGAVVAMGVPDGGADAADAAREAGPPPTYTELYRNFFGPTGSASCTRNPGQCHGGPTEDGTNSANGFMCIPDQAGCYAGMVTGGLFVPGSRDADAGLNPLTHVLRHRDDPSSPLLSGNVPLQPSSKVFTPEEMDGIRRWVESGAPNN